MTAQEFNEKYKDYIEDGFYGLGVDIPEFTLWLDEKFSEFIKVPGFNFAQIKYKWGSGRFYCNGLTDEQIREVEKKISEI